MASRKETPVSLYSGHYQDDHHAIEPTTPPYSPIACGEQRAESEIEALMQAQPFNEPVVPRAEMRELRETIVDAIDSLSDRDKYIFDACVIRRCTLRRLGEELGYRGPHFSKTTVASHRDRVLEQLREKLEESDEIKMYLKGERR